MTPSIVSPFLLTLAISFLIGIGLREYYEGEGKFDTFGTVRTFVFIGMLGFVLFQLPEVGQSAYLVGFAGLVLFLLVYYFHKVRDKKSPGLIGVLIGMMTYATGPIALRFEHWYLVLLAISVLLVVHSKGRIRRLTDRLETGEVVTACKFLAIAAVVLPLVPEKAVAQGMLGTVLAALPVTPRQIWVAVVITTAISYLGYVLHTYLFPRRGLVLTGLVGGVYSSTVAVVVLAKKSRSSPGLGRQASIGIALAVSMMYLRLLVLVAAFRFPSALSVGPALLVLSALAGLYALGLQRWRPADPAQPAAPLPEGATADASNDPDLRRNPLELNAAFLFAVMFVAVALVTKYVLTHFQALGLRMLSFVVGFSDITPFVVSLLQGNLGIDDRQILQAVVIASASNNVLKTVYSYVFGDRRTADAVAPGLLGLALLSVGYAFLLL